MWPPCIMQSVGFSRPEYRVVSFPLLWDLPNPDIEAGSPALHANCLPYEPHILFVFFPPSPQLLLLEFSSLQLSRVWLCHPMNRSMAGLPCPSHIPGAYSDSCPSSRWCHPAIWCSAVPFSSCPQSLPASRTFPMSQLFGWGGQSIGVSASASVLPVNTQDWSPLGWTGWISLQSKGLSAVFSNTTVQKHQVFSAQLSSQSNSHIHTWPLEKPQPWLDGPLLAM